jgi:AbrB family looped-hinge helix DNA binding protein
MSCSKVFYGAVTVGERGQVVIPAEARAELRIQPGDKLIAMRHPLHQGLMLVRFESLRQFLDEFGESLNQVQEAEE